MWTDHKGGQRVPGSLCDVVFNSRDGDEAEASTPDEVLHEKDSMCTYTVLTHEPYYTHVELVIYKLLWVALTGQSMVFYSLNNNWVTAVIGWSRRVTIGQG